MFQILYSFFVEPLISDTRNKIQKTINTILAMLAIDPAIPPNPKTAATTAKMKNVNAKLSISPPFF
jgi:hypothetical protein